MVHAKKNKKNLGQLTMMRFFHYLHNNFLLFLKKIEENVNKKLQPLFILYALKQNESEGGFIFV